MIPPKASPYRSKAYIFKPVLYAITIAVHFTTVLIFVCKIPKILYQRVSLRANNTTSNSEVKKKGLDELQSSRPRHPYFLHSVLWVSSTEVDIL